ncbi:hypothetical protein SS50377_26704 [Spironucleus salmonicida]|uniref:Uncharacterized protein n=1 Tax=Spironucleus salmonicida TaxID=348837 RepID=A0A9P8RV65_9EUKA|nr:hypothetical protein SS50377_26704 [Spironucleus salmonicida]
MIKLPQVFSVQRSRIASPAKTSLFYSNNQEPLYLVGNSYDEKYVVNTFSQNVQHQIISSLQPYKVPFQQPQTQFVFQNAYQKRKLQKKIDALQITVGFE